MPRHRPRRSRQAVESEEYRNFMRGIDQFRDCGCPISQVDADDLFMKALASQERQKLILRTASN